MLQGGMLTIELPEIEIDALPDSSSAPLLQGRAFLEGFSLVQVKNNQIGKVITGVTIANMP
jgi:hypothetical protein